MTNENTFLQHALVYARRGWAVFPLKERDKTPATANGFQNATTDVDVITRWWTQRPNQNIGIATGDVSGGLVVIDVDVHDDDSTALDFMYEWSEQNGALPLTLSQTTGSGGMHLLFDAGAPCNISISTNSLVHIDIRANGGYIVAPPSIHPNGCAYRWSSEVKETAKLTPIVVKFIDDIQQKHKITYGRNYYALPDKVKKGGRNDEMFRYAASLQAKGLCNDDIMNALCVANNEHFDPPLSNVELSKIMNSVTARYQKGTGCNIASLPDSDYRKYLNNKTNRTGATYVTNDTQNYVMVLENDEKLANHFFYDVRACQVMLEAGLPLPFIRTAHRRALTDVDYIALQTYLEGLPFNPASDDSSDSSTRTMMFNGVSKEKCIDAINLVAMSHPRNLAQEWLESLKWDGEPRADGVLYTFLGCKLDDYNIEVTRILLNGIVTRALYPGAKFDYIPVLVGKQGIGKSQFCRALCPCEEWYLDGLNTMEGDEAIEKIRNKLIVEVAELANLRRDKLESVKSFLTRQVDTFRPKYARNAEDRPRACVFIGTTNVNQFLVDKTGNRRWLPVQCGVCEPTLDLFDASTKFYMEQVWAEVMHKFKQARPTLTLPTSILDEAYRRQELACEEDSRVGVIEEWLEAQRQNALTNSNAEREKCRVCARQIAVEVFDVPNPKFEVSDINQLLQLKIEGWERVEKRKRCGRYGPQVVYIPTKENWQRPVNL